MPTDAIGEPANGEASPHHNQADANPSELGVPGANPNAQIDPRPPNQEANDKRYDRIISGGTLFVLFLTFGAALYAGCEAQRLANLTQNIITDSRNSIRPWVGVYDIDTKSLPITMQIKNTGQSPALNLRGEFKFKIISASDGLPSSEECKSGCSLATLLPNAASSYVPDTLPEMTDIRAIIDAGKILVLYGRLDYLDQFDNPHHTLFCGTYNKLGSFSPCALKGANDAT